MKKKRFAKKSPQLPKPLWKGFWITLFLKQTGIFDWWGLDQFKLTRNTSQPNLFRKPDIFHAQHLIPPSHAHPFVINWPVSRVNHYQENESRIWVTMWSRSNKMATNAAPSIFLMLMWVLNFSIPWALLTVLAFKSFRQSSLPPTPTKFVCPFFLLLLQFLL